MEEGARAPFLSEQPRAPRFSALRLALAATCAAALIAGTAVVEGQRPARAEASAASEAALAAPATALAEAATALAAPAPNFFLVKQTFKAGQEDGFWQEYADLMKDAVGNADKWADQGYINDAFMSTPQGGPVFVLWEAKPGKSGEDMQAFIDDLMGEWLNNDVMAIDPKLWMAPPLPSIWGGAKFMPAAKPSYSEIGLASTWYIVEHTLKVGKEKEWWTFFGSFTPAMLDEMAEANEKKGLSNPTFMPAGSAGPFYCIWEVKAGYSAGYLQSTLDASFGKYLNNNIMRIDTSQGYLLPWASKV